MVLNFRISGVRMRKHDARWYMPAMTVTYSVVNYCACKAYNRTSIYWFMDWDSPAVLVVLSVIAFFGYYVHYAAAIISIRLTGGTKTESGLSLDEKAKGDPKTEALWKRVREMESQ